MSLSNRKLFCCVCIAWYKHSRGWENSRQFCKPSSRVCITVSIFYKITSSKNYNAGKDKNNSFYWSKRTFLQHWFANRISQLTNHFENLVLACLQLVYLCVTHPCLHTLTQTRLSANQSARTISVILHKKYTLTSKHTNANWHTIQPYLEQKICSWYQARKMHHLSTLSSVSLWFFCSNLNSSWMPSSSCCRCFSFSFSVTSSWIFAWRRKSFLSLWARSFIDKMPTCEKLF